MTAIEQGDDTYQRTGGKITAKNMFVRAQFELPTSGLTLDNSNTTALRVRFIILMDRFNQGAAPALSDVLESPSDFNGFMKWINRKRFKILMDKMFDLPFIKAFNASGAEAVAVPQDKSFKWIKKKIRLHKSLIYRGTNDTTASQGINSIWWTAFTDLNLDHEPAFYMTARMTFQDL